MVMVIGHYSSVRFESLSWPRSSRTDRRYYDSFHLSDRSTRRLISEYTIKNYRQFANKMRPRKWVGRNTGIKPQQPVM